MEKLQARHGEQPYGCRSCFVSLDAQGALSERHQPPPYEWSDPDGPSYSERTLAATTAGISLHQLAEAYGAFRDTLESALSGALTFGRGHRFDVDRMDCTSDVLEIKWTNLPPGAKRRQMWLRLYFAEPAELPRQIVRLRLTYKTSDGDKQQTQDACDAQDDLDAYMRTKEKQHD